MSEFYDYVRGVTEVVPAGYSAAGMRVYRHLVLLGVRQLLQSHFPDVRPAIGDTAWEALLTEFVRQSRWDSPFYGDLKNEFIIFLERESV